MLSAAQQIILLDQFMLDMHDLGLECQRYLLGDQITLGVSCKTIHEITNVRSVTMVPLALDVLEYHTIVYVDLDGNTQMSNEDEQSPKPYLAQSNAGCCESMANIISQQHIARDSC